MNVQNNYLKSLNTLKHTFIGTDESVKIIQTIQSIVKDQEIDYLEVGYGDGRFVHRVYDTLKQDSIQMRITAIDPSLDSTHDVQKQIPDISIHSTTFEAFQTDQLFDVINVRHSLYYITHPIVQIKRMLSMLKPGGILIITIWSINCDLYHLYEADYIEKYGKKPDSLLTAEGIVHYIKDLSNTHSTHVTYTKTSIMMSAWRQSVETLRHVYTILQRNKTTDIEPDDFKRFQHIFSTTSVNEERVIGVVTCQKTPNHR